MWTCTHVVSVCLVDVYLCVSVAGLGLEDVSGNGHHCQVLSLGQDTLVSSVDLTVFLEQESKSMDPSVPALDRSESSCSHLSQLMVSGMGAGLVGGVGQGGGVELYALQYVYMYEIRMTSQFLSQPSFTH